MYFDEKVYHIQGIHTVLRASERVKQSQRGLSPSFAQNTVSA